MSTTTTKDEIITIVEHREATITGRETRLAELLTDISAANDAGEQPSKADLTRGMASKTRANHYKAIDTLIARQMVANEGVGNTYALVVTEVGDRILAGEQAVTVAVERTVPAERIWTVVDHTIDGARFVSSPFYGRAVAEDQAAKHAERTEHLAAVTIVESVRPRFAQVDAADLPESTTTVVWERAR